MNIKERRTPVIVKDKNKRITITMDKELLIACEKLIKKIKESGIKDIRNMSQLVQKALLEYINSLAYISSTLIKEEDTHAN